MFCGIKSYNKCSNAVLRHWHSPTIVLSLVYCPVDDTLFEISPSVSSRYCCYTGFFETPYIVCYVNY